MKMKNICKSLMWPLGTIILYGLLHNLLYGKVIIPFWSYLDVEEGEWLDISVGLSSVVCILLGWKSKRKSYSIHHIGFFLSVIVLILLFRYDNVDAPYLSFYKIMPCWFLLLYTYITGILLHYLYDWIRSLLCKRKDDNDKNVVQLFQDKPISRIDKDELFFGEFSRMIANAIINYTKEDSFSIGVTGSWGSGKTTVLFFIKELLESRNDTIVIAFTPRQSATVQDIQKDFLSELADNLSVYHSGAQRITYRYMQSIGTLPDKLWALRLFGFLMDADIIQRRNSIKDVIDQIGKKIVVLIDDFDRLSGEEIQEVLKLIDKNAAFPRTFFITAYDKKQTNLVISKFLGYANDDKKTEYTDKYFNLEVSLPIRRQSNFIKVLRENLYSLADDNRIIFKRNEIDEALPKIYPYIYNYLPNLRDIKRFTNLVSISLPQVENDVLLGDFLLVSLIRYRYPDEYYKLSKYEYVYRDGSTIPKKKFYLLKTFKLENVECKDILKVLFNGNDAPYKAVSHLSSFANYFYDIDSGHLSYRELSKLLDPEITPDSFKTIVRNTVKRNNEIEDFVGFILSYENNNKSIEDTVWYFKLFLMSRSYCESRDFYIATLSYLYKDNVQDNYKRFGFKDETAYVGFLRDVLNDKFDYHLSIESLHDALHYITTKDSGKKPQLVFSFDELITMARLKLERAISDIQNHSIVLNDVYRSYKACVIEYIPDDHGESLDSEATEIIRAAITKYPDFFLKEFVSHRKASNMKSAIQFYINSDIPYLNIFKSKEDIRAFIKEIASDSDSTIILCVSQFIDMCIAQTTWEPILNIRGDISSIKQHDYAMYNQLFEGEPTYA